MEIHFCQIKSSFPAISVFEVISRWAPPLYDPLYVCVCVRLSQIRILFRRFIRPLPQVTSTPGHWNNRTQGPRDKRTQGHQVTRTLGHWDTRTLGLRHTWTLHSRLAWETISQKGNFHQNCCHISNFYSPWVTDDCTNQFLAKFWQNFFEWAIKFNNGPS